MLKEIDMEKNFVYRMTWVREDGRDGMLTFEGTPEGLAEAKGFAVYLQSQMCRDIKITRQEKRY